MESLLAKPEMVRDLMEDGLPDLGLEVRTREPELEVGDTEDCDLVGEVSGVVDAALGKGYAFVQSEKARLIPRGPFLNDDCEILYLGEDVFWDLVESSVDDVFEFRS